jgi:hypothetical protein
MRKFIDKITPSFILAYNARLLKNAPLGWQLQLPTITWVWLLITIITLPIPFFITLEKRGDDDVLAAILISVLTAVLEGFLFAYIVIQFNNTKTFGRRVFLNGFKEQLAYLYVFMLCMLHIIFYPLIVDIRKGNLMTAEEIRKEAVTYNQASFYFMSDARAYRYFPTDETFLHYEELEGSAEYRGDNDHLQSKETYYIETVKPMMRAYFSGESEFSSPKCTRDVVGCPKMYMIEDNYISEHYYGDYDFDYRRNLYFEKYQLKKKSDEERLKDIVDFIKMYTKYSDDYYGNVGFQQPEIILSNYKSNRFISCFHETDNISDGITSVDVYAVEPASNISQLDGYRISSVHNTISGSQKYKWRDLWVRLGITFHVALCLSVLLFIFKNIRLREFILTFVYSALLVLAVIILTIVLFQDEAFAIHVMWVVFLLGIYFSFFEQNAKHYSSLKTTFILLTNAVFSYAPLVIYVYFHEYLTMWHLPDDFSCTASTGNQAICDAHYQMHQILFHGLLWGGPVFYILFGSTLYKKTYERLLALPLAK